MAQAIDRVGNPFLPPARSLRTRSHGPSQGLCTGPANAGLDSRTQARPSLRGHVTGFETRRPANAGFQNKKRRLRKALSQKTIFMNQNSDSITVGKYLVSPLTKVLENGWYACSVSIRAGSGSGRHDRVLRPTRLFRSQLAAARHATAEGLQWIGQRHPALEVAAAAAL